MPNQNSALFLGTLLLVGSAVAGCGTSMEDGAMTMEEPPPVPRMEHPEEPEPCTTSAFCFDPEFGSQLPALTLGEKTTFNTSVVLSKQLMGQTVNFSVVTSVPAADLVIEVVPKTIQAGVDANIPVSISLQIPTNSAFDGKKPITLHAEVMGPVGLTGDSKALNLPFEPKLIVEYSGRGGSATPHTWIIPGNEPLKIGAAGQQAPTMVRLRPQGVRVDFINKDTSASHVLHCSGVIPHQPTDKPTPPNGVYSPLVQTAGGASCYDHNVESQSVAVYFQFNR